MFQSRFQLFALSDFLAPICRSDAVLSSPRPRSIYTTTKPLAPLPVIRNPAPASSNFLLLIVKAALTLTSWCLSQTLPDILCTVRGCWTGTRLQKRQNRLKCYEQGVLTPPDWYINCQYAQAPMMSNYTYFPPPSQGETVGWDLHFLERSDYLGGNVWQQPLRPGTHKGPVCCDPDRVCCGQVCFSVTQPVWALRKCCTHWHVP